MAGKRDDELKLPSYMNHKVEGASRQASTSVSKKTSKKQRAAVERAAREEAAERAAKERAAREKMAEREARERAAREDAAERAAKERAAREKMAQRAARERAAREEAAERAAKERAAQEKATERALARERAAKRTESELHERTAARRTPQRAKRRLNVGRIMILLMAVALAAGGAIYFINGANDTSNIIIGETQRLPDGVKVLGLDVGGETKHAARNAVEQKADRILKEAMVTIRCDGEEYNISGTDVSLSYDVENVMQRAMQYDPSTAEIVNVATTSQGNEINDIFTWNARELELAIENIASTFNDAASEATATATEGADHSVTFAFADGKPGRVLNTEETKKNIEAQFSLGNYTFETEGDYERIEPSCTAADLQKSITLRASYTTVFPTSSSDETIKGRVFNIEKAAGIINGCVVQPNEEWSFNGFVGLRTYESGWKAANGIADGKEYVLQAGGGICQVSSTLYNALLCADIEVTDRRAHTIPSTYVPKGLDATVDSSGIDLQFKNDTGAPVFLYAYIEDVPDSHKKSITINIYGASLGEGVTYQTRSEVIDVVDRGNDVHYSDDLTIPRGYKIVKLAARDGYKVEAYRDKYLNGIKTESELLYTDVYKGNAEESVRGAASPKYFTAPSNAVKID